MYNQEYNFGIAFESYALAGMHEFWENYNLDLDRLGLQRASAQIRF